ncbi:MAG: hypothetical protein KAY37_11535 [Phycisphaerae bacterium]|nr:hypothetical protein [Phycisphaerae bacterium]
MEGNSVSTDSANAIELTLPPSFPAGDYTPHGYLDNPYHTMVSNRGGVIRSVPPLGFGYWLRSFKGAYGTGTHGHVNYLSILKMTLACDDLRLVSAPDFATAGIELSSRYHSKHMLSYDFQHQGLTYSFRYFLPREHTLACLIEVANSGNTAKEVYLHAVHVYGLWETEWWGSDGLAMRYLAEPDAGVSCITAYGDYFALGANIPSFAHKATGVRDELPGWLRENDLTSRAQTTVHGPGPLHTVMTYKLSVPAEGRATALICLSRGVNEPAALAELDTGLADAIPTLEQQLDRDEAFWSHCPRLEGDWPESWKRGWVYDWETLRMNVRPPTGIFKHHWDAMQVHSPRSVLAQAGLDMLALSHADPELAQDVLLGTFADAPQPNVPGCREDGSVNMIAADGEACGTSPAWCLPFLAVRAIYAATHDAEWLAELYPHLKSYLDWWLEHRTDRQGWLHYKCAREAGQEGSHRFPESTGDDINRQSSIINRQLSRRFPESAGGEIGFIRAVDVQAAMAAAMQDMVLLAQVAGAPLDVPRWTELADRTAAAAREMFIDGWFRDFDTRANEPIIRPDDVEVAMLTPLACGVATANQVEAVKPKFQILRDNPQHWLERPPFFLTYAEAAWRAGQRMLSAEVAADIADRIYPRLDARAVRFDEPSKPFAYRVPGVACEWWPSAENEEPGGENFGWGATLPLHVIRGIIGFRETDSLPAPDTEGEPDVEFHLAPALPERLATPGKSYTMRNLNFRGVNLNIRYDVQSPTRLRVTLDYVTPTPGTITVTDQSGQTVASATSEDEIGAQTFDLANGHVYVVRFSA